MTSESPLFSVGNRVVWTKAKEAGITFSGVVTELVVTSAQEIRNGVCYPVSAPYFCKQYMVLIDGCTLPILIPEKFLILGPAPEGH